MNISDSSLLSERSAFIGGQWVPAKDDNQTFEVFNPSTWKTITEVPDLDEAACLQAVEEAQQAFTQLSSMSGKQRGQLLRNWLDLVNKAKDDLATIISTENGKLRPEAVGEVAYAADFIDWYAGAAPRVEGTVIQSSDPSKRVFAVKQPVGVVGIITPWNFPAAMITRKVAAALAAGCPCIVKPSPETPLTALALAGLAAKAGFPPGSLTIVTTQKNTIAVGKVLTEHPVIKKFSFTGSSAVGKLLAAQCAGTVKRVSLELGGNAPFIVFDDADLEAAADAIMASKFRLSGQTCVCTNRVYVQDGVYSKMAEILATKTRQLELGPLINKVAVKRVEKHIEDAVSKGAKVLVGGHTSKPDSSYFDATILTDVPRDAVCSREETFGPLLPLIRFEDEDSVVKMANNTEFGLAGYFFTENVTRAWTLAERLEVGMVGVNTGLISDVASPFGGLKESGLGREGSYIGIEEFLHVKSITMAMK